MRPARLAVCCALLSLGFSSLLHAGEKVLGPAENIKVTVIKGRNVSAISGGSIGEKVASFEPVVKIQNGAMHDFKGNKVCVILMGEDTTARDNWKVMYRREFDADLLAGKVFEWTGDSFEQGFDRTLAKSGYDYDGFIVLIRNADGIIAYTAQTKPVWAKDTERAWNLTEGKEYKRSFFTAK